MSLQANSILPDTFLIYPANQAFVSGQSRHIASRSSLGWLSLLMIGFVTFGGLFLAVAAREVLHWWMVESTSIVTSGEFVDRRIAPADSATNHYVTFRYLHDETIYETEQVIDQNAYDRAEIGSRVDIHFLPANPQVAKMSGSNYPPIDLSIFVVIWNIVAVSLAVSVWRQYRFQCLLERDGKLITGTLMSVQASSHNKDETLLHVDYCFVPPDTNAQISSSETIVRSDLSDAAFPAVGSPIYVLYRNPQHYVLL